MIKRHRLATNLVHAGIKRTAYGETAEALFLTSGFTYASAEEAEAAFTGQNTHYQYSRFGNPTITMLEQRLAAIEGAEACRATATGMAAIHAALLCNLKAGDRVVASRALFGSCSWIISELLPRYGVETQFVDGQDTAGWRAAFSQPATLLLLESPSNPMLDIIDVRMVCNLAHAAGAKVILDNVFATPILQQPMRFGVDIVVYSCTKHIDGQGRVLGGAVLGTQEWVEEKLQPFIRNTGPSLSPFNAWLLLKGLETLGLRVEAACARAATIADFLACQPEVARVLYPTRLDHPQYTMAKSQMTAGGSLVTFELRDGKPAAFAFMNALSLIAISNNLGDSKSLITHPATTTHQRIGPDERRRLGITDGVIRLSVGLEDVDDLCQDVADGFAACQSLTTIRAAE